MAVGKWLKKTHPKAEPPSVRVRAILDPPREGLGEEASDIVEGLKKWRVQEIVAVGCDADSWARDLARLGRAGWTLKKAGALDLFPQTPHVESLVLLVRKN
jgi:23S rRNA (uracil1939-C5)-methyltransferase